MKVFFKYTCESEKKYKCISKTGCFFLKKKQLYDSFLWMEFNCLKTTEPPWGDSLSFSLLFTFYHSVPTSSWYSIDQPRKDERLSWLWSHKVYLKYTSLLISLWTQTMLERYKSFFNYFHKDANFGSSNISKSIFEVYFSIFRA